MKKSEGIEVDSNGNIFIVGETADPSYWRFDAFLMKFKLDTNLNPLFVNIPFDMDYEFSTKGHNLSWTIIDSTVSDPFYIIYQKT